MNSKSLFLGLAVVASLVSTAKADLVLNGHLERSGTTNSVYVNSYPSGDIPNWQVLGASSSAPFNAVYIYDVLGGALPAFMPPSYYCTPPVGFISGNCVNPDGTGHFINLDGDPAFPAAIRQPIVGLEIGKQYELTFSWGAVERNDRNGPTFDNFLEISIGNLVFTTPKINLPPQGFSGWFTTSIDFTWNGSSNNFLQFLAYGNPSGLPPSINLDGISLNAVPEPSTWALLIAAGFSLLGVDARRRRKTVGR